MARFMLDSSSETANSHSAVRTAGVRSTRARLGLARKCSTFACGLHSICLHQLFSQAKKGCSEVGHFARSFWCLFAFLSLRGIGFAALTTKTQGHEETRKEGKLRPGSALRGAELLAPGSQLFIKCLAQDSQLFP